MCQSGSGGWKTVLWRPNMANASREHEHPLRKMPDVLTTWNSGMRPKTIRIEVCPVLFLLLIVSNLSGTSRINIDWMWRCGCETQPHKQQHIAKAFVGQGQFPKDGECIDDHRRRQAILFTLRSRDIMDNNLSLRVPTGAGRAFFAINYECRSSVIFFLNFSLK
jgi:hypothetical protein